jgi:hypothetical protein
MAFSVDVTVKDAATPRLQNLGSLLAPAAVARVAGAAGRNYVQDFFVRLNAERRNKLGGERTNFYSSAAKATSFTSDENGATVSVSQVGIRQRIEGGKIEPRNAKYLTIPARAEAYGKRASEFPNLKVLFGKGGKPYALGEADATKVTKGKNGFKSAGETGGAVFFWLVPSVLQAPDPTANPAASGQMRNSILEKLSQYAKLQDKRAGI